MKKRPNHHWVLLALAAVLGTWAVAKFQIVKDQVNVLHEGLSIWGKLASHATETIGLVAALFIAGAVLFLKRRK